MEPTQQSHREQSHSHRVTENRVTENRVTENRVTESQRTESQGEEEETFSCSHSHIRLTLTKLLVLSCIVLRLLVVTLLTSLSGGAPAGDPRHLASREVVGGGGEADGPDVLVEGDVLVQLHQGDVVCCRSRGYSPGGR